MLKDIWKLLVAVLIGFMALNLLLGIASSLGFTWPYRIVFDPLGTLKSLTSAQSGSAG